METVGIIGFGQFGQFLMQHLEPHLDVHAYDINGKSPHSLEEVCACDVVIFAVPVQSLEAACKKAAPFLKESTRIADVASVKVRPLEILRTYFPDHALLGTHPIFGPQSGKDGIAGLPIVFSNLSWNESEYQKVREFCSSTLGLHVIERSPDEHDREMAHVMALSHFIGRALKHLDIKDYETNTFSYHQLVELRDLLKEDSWELFETIQKENPYAQEVRTNFLKELRSLEERLNS